MLKGQALAVPCRDAVLLEWVLLRGTMAHTCTPGSVLALQGLGSPSQGVVLLLTDSYHLQERGGGFLVFG